MSEFKKEDRYLVIKRSDIEKFLTCTEKEELYQLAGVVRDGRTILTSKSLECVVVESDWPIYNDVWKMVEAIAANQPTELEQLRKERDELKLFVSSVANADVQREQIDVDFVGVCDITFISDTYQDKAKKLLAKLNQQGE